MANSRRRLVGRVVSDKMDKTVVVAIERRKAHPVYKKVIISTKKVMAHDENNTVEVGSFVQLVESKPISKNKRWVVEKVLETAGGRVLEPITGEVAVEPVDQPEAGETPVKPAEEPEAGETPAAEETAHDPE